MRKLWLVRAAVPAALILTMLLVAAPAMAIWEWCEMDPELVIDGHAVTLQALVEGESGQVAQAVRGNTWFRVYIPRGVDGAVVSTEDKVKAKIFEDKELVTDGAGAIPFNVALTVNTHGTYPLCLIVSVDGEIVGEVFGNTSDGIKAEFSLP